MTRSQWPTLWPRLATFWPRLPTLPLASLSLSLTFAATKSALSLSLLSPLSLSLSLSLSLPSLSLLSLSLSLPSLSLSFSPPPPSLSLSVCQRSYRVATKVPISSQGYDSIKDSGGPPLPRRTLYLFIYQGGMDIPVGVKVIASTVGW